MYYPEKADKKKFPHHLHKFHVVAAFIAFKAL